MSSVSVGRIDATGVVEFRGRYQRLAYDNLPAPAEGTVRMLEDHPAIGAAVVVMGRAHVSGYTRILVEEHGFAAV